MERCARGISYVSAECSNIVLWCITKKERVEEEERSGGKKGRENRREMEIGRIGKKMETG